MALDQSHRKNWEAFILEKSKLYLKHCHPTKKNKKEGKNLGPGGLNQKLTFKEEIIPFLYKFV